MEKAVFEYVEKEMKKMVSEHIERDLLPKLKHVGKFNPHVEFEEAYEDGSHLIVLTQELENGAIFGKAVVYKKDDLSELSNKHAVRYFIRYDLKVPFDIGVDIAIGDLDRGNVFKSRKVFNGTLSVFKNTLAKSENKVA